MIERVTWADFDTSFNWSQGEHVTLVGPPGAGKTTVLEAILPKRGYILFFGTKPSDPIYLKMMRDGYKRVESFNEIKSFDKKILLWPKMSATIPATLANQRAQFRLALDQVVREGGWTVVIDESKYVAEQLGLRKEINFCVDQLRSNKSSVVCGTQRPAWLPQSVLSNATHVFLWKTTNREDQIKLADVGGIDAGLVRDEAKKLGNHEFIYIKTRGVNSHMVISQVRR